MKLTNRQLAALLGVSVSHVARAAAVRNYFRSPDGTYVVPDDAPRGDPEPAEPPPQAKVYEPSIGASVARLVEQRAFRLVCFASDIHIPEHDPFAVRAWLAWVERSQPDVIILGGDILELESCSGHGGNIHSAPLFTAEIEAGNRFLDDVQRAAPNAEIHYLEGNHETRLGRKVDAQIPTLAGALTIPSLLRLSERGIKWLPYGKVLFVDGGKLGYTHGTRANDHHAKAHLTAYGTSIVYGHTHRAQFYTQGFANNRLRGAFGAPCLRSISVDWIKGPTGWSQGFVIAHAFPDGHFTAYTIMMDQQRFVDGGVLYDGRA